MPTTSLPRVLARRWYIVVVGLVLTAVLVAAVGHRVTPTYKASASVLLRPPAAHAGGNPYLELSGLQPVADVLSSAMTDDQTANAVNADGFIGKYSVARDQSVSGPVLAVTGEASSATGALAMLNHVVGLIAPRLLQIQQSANVSPESMLTVEVLNTPTKATAQTKSQTRAVLAAAVAGTVLTLLLVLGSERLLGSRRRRTTTYRDEAITAAGSAEIESEDKSQPLAVVLDESDWATRYLDPPTVDAEQAINGHWTAESQLPSRVNRARERNRSSRRRASPRS